VNPTAATRRIADSGGRQAVRAADDGGRHVGAEHVKRAVRDVDDPHHAEHQREPAGDQEQQRRGEETIQRLGDQVRHSMGG
jgi:hypothetical protein